LQHMGTKAGEAREGQDIETVEKTVHSEKGNAAIV
jgi:hypothetical protein